MALPKTNGCYVTSNQSDWPTLFTVPLSFPKPPPLAPWLEATAPVDVGGIASST